MSPRLCALVLVCFLVGSSVGDARGQEFGDHADESLLADDQDVTLEVNEPTDVTFSLTPALLKGLDTASYLQRGQVYSSIDFAMLSVTDKAFQTNGDFTMAPRFQLGWESERGFGVRGRYWEFENTMRGSSDAGTALTPPLDSNITFIHTDNHHVNNFAIAPRTYADSRLFAASLSSANVDLYQQFVAGASKLLIGAGLHAVSSTRQTENLYDSINFMGNQLVAVDHATVTIEGLGPSLVSEVQRPITAGRLGEVTFVIGGRSSILPAEFETQVEFARTSTDGKLWITEGSAGLELANHYRSLTLRIRTLLETQYWASDVTDNQAFTGANVSLGITW